MTSHLAASRQQILFPEVSASKNISVRQTVIPFPEATNYLNNQYYIYMIYNKNSCIGLGGNHLAKEIITLRDDNQMPIFDASSVQNYFNQVAAYTDSHTDVDMSQYEVALWCEVGCASDL